MALLCGIQAFVIVTNLVMNVIIVIPVFALVAWFVSLTPAGTWVAEGLKLLYISVKSADLYKLGAALGFIKCFIMRSGNNHTRSKADNT
jgi:hypothetical protein